MGRLAPVILPTDSIDANVAGTAATIRQLESNNNYKAPPNAGGASGAYQFIGPTWQNLTKKYGVGTSYPQAYMAPPDIQDKVAQSYIKDIITSNGGDILAVPYTWYVGNPQGTWSEGGKTHDPATDVPYASQGNKLTPNDYVKKWIDTFQKVAGDAVAGGTIDQAATVAGNIGNAITAIPDFLQWIFTAIHDRDNWIRVGLISGAIILSIFGMLTISKSFGGPGVSDVSKSAVKMGATAAVA